MYLNVCFILPPFWELFVNKIVLPQLLGRNWKAIAFFVELAVFQVAGFVVELISDDSECGTLIVI